MPWVIFFLLCAFILSPSEPSPSWMPWLRYPAPPPSQGCTCSTFTNASPPLLVLLPLLLIYVPLPWGGLPAGRSMRGGEGGSARGGGRGRRWGGWGEDGRGWGDNVRHRGELSVLQARPATGKVKVVLKKVTTYLSGTGGSLENWWSLWYLI